MFERFTDRARRVMRLAAVSARNLNHEYVGTEHILLGLLEEGRGVGLDVLKSFDLDLKKIREEVLKFTKMGPEMVALGDNLPNTPRAKKVIEYAKEEAQNLNHNYVGTEHLLLGLLREHDGVAAQVLMNLGLKLEKVRQEVLNLLGAGPESKPKPDAKESVVGEEMDELLLGEETDSLNKIFKRLILAIKALPEDERKNLLVTLRSALDHLEKETS